MLRESELLRSQHTNTSRKRKRKAVPLQGHALLQFWILNKAGAGYCDALQSPARGKERSTSLQLAGQPSGELEVAAAGIAGGRADRSEGDFAL
jgi:hypothetical protein